MLQKRQDARAEKDFKRADEIRDLLAEMGLEVKDTSEGPQLKKLP